MCADERLLVSIGVPVFNGEAGIARALDSLLRQDYPHLEILISDNASTDATASICLRYAQIDQRVKYWRTETHHDVAWNYNRVFELSSGEYFMWAAHDDRREPTFVSACVERMEQCPDAVLCQAHTAVSVRGRPELLYVASLDSFDGAAGLVARYRETLKRFPATAVYGLYRASAVRKTHLFLRVMGTDVSFVQELSIQGRFIQVPRVLFKYDSRERWNTVHQDAQYFLGTKTKPWWYLPFVALFVDHCRRLASAAIPLSMKLRLSSVLVAHEIRRLARRAFIRTAGWCCPAPMKETLARAICRRWMHNPNVVVVSPEPFMTHVCKPQLGWWT